MGAAPLSSPDLPLAADSHDSASERALSDSSDRFAPRTRSRAESARGITRTVAATVTTSSANVTSRRYISLRGARGQTGPRASHPPRG